MIHYLRGAATSAIVLLATQQASSADGVLLAAHVDGITGRSTHCVIARGEQKIALIFHMPLLNGDKIVVTGKDAEVRIHFVDGHIVAIGEGRSPYTVQTAAATPSAATNFLQALWEDVTKAHDLGLYSNTVRDGADAARQPILSLAMPGLGNGSAMIAAGPRHFALEWIGGRPPYRVTLRNAGGAVLADESNLQTRQLTLSSRLIDFAPGQYAVEVTDGAGATVKGRFSATVTAIPARISAVPVMSDIDYALEDGASLAARHEPALAYEAYLRLYPAIHAHVEPAQALADYIASGAPGSPHP